MTGPKDYGIRFQVNWRTRVSKKFSGNLYAQNDAAARSAVKAHFGPKCLDNPDKYGVDLMYRGRMIEVEIKQHWQLQDEFPYDLVQISERKGKFRGANTEFWILNKYINRAIIIPSHLLHKRYLKEVPNKYVPAGEYFYCIPVRLCKVIRLKNSDKL